MKTKLDAQTTGHCPVCGTVKKGLSRTGSKKRDWACFDCIDTLPSVAQAVRDYDRVRQAQADGR